MGPQLSEEDSLPRSWEGCLVPVWEGEGGCQVLVRKLYPQLHLLLETPHSKPHVGQGLVGVELSETWPKESKSRSMAYAPHNKADQKVDTPSGTTIMRL